MMHDRKTEISFDEEEWDDNEGTYGSAILYGVEPTDQDMVDTGLVDADGAPIYAYTVHRPMGFCR